jgi:hypothetical protein
LVHGLHDLDALLLDGSSDHGALALPKDIRTVEERAQGSVFVDDDVLRAEPFETHGIELRELWAPR